MSGHIIAVHRSPDHTFTKPTVESIELVAGLGVAGDAHMGARVKHRSRVAADPTRPNLRQVHLIHRELFDHVAAKGFDVAPGDLGENVTTADIDLLAMPVGTVLRLGDDALVALTGLRNPCKQIDGFSDGLLGAVLERDAAGGLVRLAGVMSVVVHGGTVRPGDGIEVSLPPGPHRRLERV
ncbi:MAG: MOSC domain-containing protein [Actinomycetota bacterium]